MVFGVLVVAGYPVRNRMLNILRQKFPETYLALGQPELMEASWSLREQNLSSFIWKLRFLALKDLELTLNCLFQMAIAIAALCLFVTMAFVD
jgi:hypothetical protein